MAIGFSAAGQGFDSARGIRRSAAARREKSKSPFLSFVFAVGLVFISSAFTIDLGAFDSTGGGPIALQIISALTGLCGLVLILMTRDARRFAIRCWPILAVVALAFLSASWSFDPAQALKKSGTLLGTVLFLLAFTMRYSPSECIRMILRVLVFECALSIVWVIVFPDVGVQLKTGLAEVDDQVGFWWRGIFSHKQGLGVAAGLTAGLLTFYGRVAFRSLIGRILAILVCLTCLAGSRSATGVVTMMMTVATLYLLYSVATRTRGGARNLIIYAATLSVSFIYLVWSYGHLNFLTAILGKSSDLSGREAYIDIAVEVLKSSGASLLGGGYAVGIQRLLPEFVYVDNGYVDLLMQFGYVGSLGIIAFVGWMFFAGKGLIVRASPASAAMNIFPMTIVLIFALINITEANFLYSKSVSIIFTVLAVGMIIQMSDQQKSAGIERNGRRLSLHSGRR